MGADQLGEERSDPTAALRVRAFFGLPLPDAHRDQLQRYLDQCAKAAPQFRWTPAANLHLTIRFLGHLELSLAEAIADRVADLELKPIDLALGESGAFKRGRLVRVLWLGLSDGEREAADLAAIVEKECERAGLDPETRPLHPHLTLARARARDGAALPELPAAPVLEGWRARELVLYQSRLGRAGSTYEPLRTLRLG